jgi:hypothetical protein
VSKRFELCVLLTNSLWQAHNYILIGIKMVKNLFFATGVVNSFSLILIFILQESYLPIIQSYGWVYLLLGIPAIYLIFLTWKEPNAIQYIVFLGTFIAFLVIEGLFDFVLKLPFRNNWQLLTPYLVLYYAMNYGFIVIVWKNSRKRGFLMLILFVIQIIFNMITH